jgi:hypothetical protein
MERKYLYLAGLLIVMAVLMDTHVISYYLNSYYASKESFSLTHESISQPTIYPINDLDIKMDAVSTIDLTVLDKNTKIWIWNGNTPSRELSVDMSNIILFNYLSPNPLLINVIQADSISPGQDALAVRKEKISQSRHWIWLDNSFCSRYCVAELLSYIGAGACSCGHGFRE